SCMVFVIVVLVLLILMYHRTHDCCRLQFPQPSQQNQNNFQVNPPLYYSSNQSLVESSHTGPCAAMYCDNPLNPKDQPFFINLVSLQVPQWEPRLPHLPSYESVRKKDRQREIHRMIADRFGLNPSHSVAPPSYEESQRHSGEFT
uniref:Uncharacterized protein n=1 Tax=Latimeria chalumnae TaxID=7897 RepID=H3B5W0_LATCH